mgnify:CR=1 FL=1
MFKNILVPTDGSSLSKRAAKQAAELAKATGARITAFHVAPAYKFAMNEDYVPRDYALPADYADHVKKVAEKHLGEVAKAAKAQGVSCEGHYASSDFPADAIAKAVKKYKCDGVLMASHGRSGLGKLFLGSETQKVLAEVTVPVIVVR